MAPEGGEPMPSPFPGMDPYLEGARWMAVHAQLTAEIARQLAPKLRPKYVALTTERFVLDEADDVAVATSSPYPDVLVVPSGRSGAIDPAPAIAPAPLQLETVVPVPVPHRAVEIRDTARRQLVTAIEVLSPTNKRGRGRREYLAKRRRLLLSSAHLLEIDLLRDGRRVPMRQPLPAVPYCVVLSRAERRPLSDVWPIGLRERLPTVPVPLLPGDADVPLDLQAALATIYDAVGFDLVVDYAQPPDVPLAGDDAAWAAGLIRG
jgi:hypothetical protein